MSKLELRSKKKRTNLFVLLFQTSHSPSSRGLNVDEVVVDVVVLVVLVVVVLVVVVGRKLHRPVLFVTVFLAVAFHIQVLSSMQSCSFRNSQGGKSKAEISTVLN